MINSFESLKLAAYKCQAGLYTIGYGHNKNVKYKDIISNSRADFLVQDIYFIE
ncbi:glycoside hydrolase family protein [Gilliamella apicola]|uniref:glycoside hydrolase family protein n=1 Tax=Gilliamella apicola TaxID=1196095 RepID=UPI003CC83421